MQFFDQIFLIRYFNLPYSFIKSRYKVGQHYLVYGQVSKELGYFVITHPHKVNINKNPNNIKEQVFGKHPDNEQNKKEKKAAKLRHL